MYLTEYWNDDDDEDEILSLPNLNEQLELTIDFEQPKERESASQNKPFIQS